jgi:hypothetical protein
MATFVTCLFDHAKYDESSLLLFAQTGIPMVIFLPPECIEQAIALTNDSQHLMIRPLLPPFSKELNFKEFFLQGLSLPNTRNLEKDTAVHLWNMHSKAQYLNAVALENPFKSVNFAWIDFDIRHIFFKEEKTWNLLRTQFLGGSQEPVYGLKSAMQNNIWVPGCLDKVTAEDSNSVGFKHHVHWRFCGSFLFGSSHAVLRLHHLYKTHFRSFLTSDSSTTLSWEVNFWAWLEANNLWKPKWYKADHNDSLIDIPDMVGFHIACDNIDFRKFSYKYPDLSPYRPSSASYIKYNGKEYINTRYVNYWIYPGGGYYYPEDEGVLRTKNVLSELAVGNLGELIPVSYDEVFENVSQTKRTGCFSEGIEDLRLFVSVDTTLKCIGTTCSYSHNEKVRMIVGTYDLDQKCITDCSTIEPPTDTWVEKNWAPILLSFGSYENQDAFIYQWHPLEIGVCVADTLMIVCSHPTPSMVFQKMKGSTPFVLHTLDFEEGFIGLIHGNEDTVPRQYYHRLVFLDKNTYKVKSYTEAFCFMKPSVEFCVGSKYDESRGVWVFWISEMDRDAAMVEIPEKWFVWIRV